MGLIVCDLKKQRSVVEETSPPQPPFLYTPPKTSPVQNTQPLSVT